ncbi:putative disease resistance protein [Camellia lanceoleosa]|uniref:Disease resistance protein n=1 Tax=Camellia lanceoleosa TaxID=1840588 RepID=A0ACC0FRK8_9ERIC|nr:putative disease resistance protein [Camellia lanceoleosa]
MAAGIGFSFLGKALERIGEYLVYPISRQFGYLFCFNTNIQNLETQLDSLKVTREGVQLGVDETRNNVRTVGPHLEAWLTKANDNTGEAETIIKDKAQVQKGCLNGWCPNPKLLYSLGRKAVKKTEELALLHAEGSNYIQPSFNPPPPSMEPIPTTTEFQGIDSRILVMNEIIQALKDDGIHLIGICGMAGVGKTTMAKEVAKRTGELFNEFPMAVVSQEPDLNKVQRCIADMLGLKLDDRESPIARAILLRKRLLLDNKKILVILDDVWAEFDLQDLGFPLGVGSDKCCKILFTSRNRNMWKEIPNKRYIQLQVLVGEEPWHLFREKVGDCADNFDLLPLAKQIVDECGGLPLALVTIGRALTNEHNQHHWNKALRQLRTPCSESSLLGVPVEVYQALYFSYKFLPDEGAKKLFLHCCLFPEDSNIAIEDLVRYGIGLRWFEGIDKVDDARDIVRVLVDQLKCYYLLLDGDFEEDTIKMHDVVRDVAISIAAKDEHGFMIIHGAKSREWPKKATYELNTSISVISNEIVEFPGGLRSSKLEFLLIQCQNSSLKIPSNFFEGMGELKVLDLSIATYITLLPSSLQFLSNLLTLHLDHCPDNISVIGKLSNLEILSFRGSEIDELPKEIGELVNLKLLDLTECGELKRIAPGVISALVQLQELYMVDCGFSWELEGEEGGENASLREFESLSNLNTLEINIEDVECLPRIPLFIKLTKYSICIGYDDDDPLYTEPITSFGKLLKLRGACTIPLECVNSLLRSSEVLEFSGMGSGDAVQELFREGVEGLQYLKKLLIDDCTTPECLVNTMGWVPRTRIFPILESLDLNRLPNLRKICHCQLPTGSFGKLKHLGIHNCDTIEEVIWNEKVEDDATNKMEFPTLESMTLWKLSMLIGFCRGTDEIEFPQLKKLELGFLPQLKWLFLNSSNPLENHNATFVSLFPHKVALPSLEELELEHLDNLEGLEHIPISICSFSKLRKLHVKCCGKWLCVFPSQFLMSLRNLEDLTVENCSLLEKVFELEMVDGKEQESEILSLLKSLKLVALPQLNYFSKRDPIGFTYMSKLSILHVHDCCNLRYLFPHSVMKCMLQLQELDIRRCTMMSMIVADEKGQGNNSVDKIEFTQLKILQLYDLPNLVSFFPEEIATLATSTECLQNVMQTLFNEKVVFPALEELKLEHLDNLEGIEHCPPSSMSLSKLRYVYVRHCGKLIKVFQAQLLSRLQNLQELSIQDCSFLEKVVDYTEHNSKIFPLLKYLKLESLPQLNHILERDYNGFMYIPQSSILRIDGCDNLRFLFTQSMTQCILQLQELEIKRCKMMSAIVREEDSQGEILVDNIEFTKLKILKLYDLQNLVSIFPKLTSTVATSFEHIQNLGQSLFNEKVAFPSLEELQLHGFQNMNEIWCNQFQTGSFNKLIELNVSDCGSLRNMFSPFMARHLVHLKRLVIIKCSMMEEVVAKEEDEEEGRINRTPLPKLECLKLIDLPELKSFCHVTHDWELPLVDNVTVLKCPEMKTFSHGVICTPKLQRVFVKQGEYTRSSGRKRKNWLWINDLNQTILHLIEKHDLADEEGENEETCETSDDSDGDEETCETYDDSDGDEETCETSDDSDGDEETRETSHDSDGDEETR